MPPALLAQGKVETSSSEENPDFRETAADTQTEHWVLKLQL